MCFWVRYFFSNRIWHWKAFEEVAFVCGVSLVPLFLLPWIEHSKNLKTWNEMFFDAIDSGQLNLYSFGLFGTLLWLVLKDKVQIVPFAPRKYLAIPVLVPAAAILIVYATDPSLRRHLSNPLILSSIIFYILYCLMYYVLLVFDKMPPPDPSESISGAELIARYQKENFGG